MQELCLLGTVFCFGGFPTTHATPILSQSALRVVSVMCGCSNNHRNNTDDKQGHVRNNHNLSCGSCNLPLTTRLDKAQCNTKRHAGWRPTSSSCRMKVEYTGAIAKARLPKTSWALRSNPPTTLMMILLRHPHMCTWIDEAQQMKGLRCRCGLAMFKGRRDVCTSVVPKGYLSLGGI